MAEEFGGVHTIERSGVERRASNWRDATDRQHEARRRQYVALVAVLDPLMVFLDTIVQEHGANDHVWLVVNATKHLAALTKHREP